MTVPEATVDRSTVRLLIVIIGILAAVGLGGTLALLVADKPGASVAVFAGLTGGLLGALTTLATNRSTVTTAQTSSPGPGTAPAPIAPDPAPEAGSGQTSGPSSAFSATEPDAIVSTVALAGPGMLGL